MNRPSEPFNAEERDLAQRLARLGGQREPAPALDAIILAAARAAVSESTPAAAPATSIEPTADPKVTPIRPRKPAPRWPLGMGLAASLVLAAGIGWRLQGDGDGSSGATAMTASAPAAEESVQAVILEPPMERTPPPPPPPLGGAADAVAQRSEVARASPADVQAKAAPAREPEFVADAAMAESVAAAPAAPLPPAPAGTSANAVAADGAVDKVTVTGSRMAAERSVGAAEYTRTPLEERRQQTPTQPAAKAAGAVAAPAASMQRDRADRSGLHDDFAADADERKESDSAKYDDRPPVSADSPEFRQAWLQRIRDHIAKGEHEAARARLQEFRRRYPGIELPEDLRKLAATLPAP